MNKIYLSRSLTLVVVSIMCVLASCKNSAGQDEKGLFSVSATKKVMFAPGNLAEDGHKFVTHQWEYGWLFGWGTGNRPADTSDNWQDYTVFHDWGKSIGDGWRTPTADEWHYLLFERTNAEEKRAVGTVNGMRGLVLLPDVWILPQDILFVHKPLDWDDNSYTDSQWELMEQAGAVFLPAAGFRWGEMPYAFDCEGLYWSSTTKEKGCPYTMHFDNNVLAVDWDNTPQFGQSVRLVRDCK